MLRSCAQDSLKKLVCDTPSTGLDVQALVLEHDCPLQGGCEIDCKVSIKAAPECTAVHIGQTGRPVNMHFSLHWSMTEIDAGCSSAEEWVCARARCKLPARCTQLLQRVCGHHGAAGTILLSLFCMPRAHACQMTTLMQNTTLCCMHAQAAQMQSHYILHGECL